MSVTDEIKSRLDIVTYIQQYVPLKKAGRYYKACCPFHSEKTPSFVVDVDRQSWRCFGACAQGGDVFGFAMKMHGWTFPEALQELGKSVGVETRTATPEQKENTARLDKLRGLLGTAAGIFHNNLLSSKEGAFALRYAREKRAFTDATITRFQVGYSLPGWRNLLDELIQLGYEADDIVAAGLAIRNDEGRIYDRFRNRLMIPIRDDRGRVVGFGARALAAEDNPKYMNSPQSEVFDKSHLLFGLDTAKRAIRDSGVAVIVEGYIDAIQAQQNGFENVIAQMGTALTETQLKLIAPRYAKRIILALDSDAAGQNATLRSLEVARQTLQADYAGRLSVDMRVLHIPNAKDPDDFIRESPDLWRELVDNAMPMADFVIEMEAAHLTSHASLQEKQEIAMRVLPILTATENDLYKQDNLQRLAMRLRVQERDLLAWAQEYRRNQPAPRKPPTERTPTPARTDSDEPEMAPLDVDSMAPPEGDYDDVTVNPVPMPRRPKAPLEVSLESYCLRMLFAQPELYYHINRKLRELAGTFSEMVTGPLSDFGVDDFTGSDYRALMQMFKLAIRQDELSVIEFMLENLDYTLRMSFERLMRGETEHIRERMKDRFIGEMEAAWKHVEQRVLPLVDFSVEFINKALRLRLERLQRERVELQYLQVDAAPEDNDLYARYIVSNARAKHLIETDIKNQSRNFL